MKVLIDTIIRETKEIKSMEKELNRQQCIKVESAKAAIAPMLSTMANPGSSEAA